MRIAIVTGASSGLGREFVREIAKREKVDVIWVIARRENRLRELAEGMAVPVEPVPLDLTDQQSFSALKALLEEKKPDIRILVNAAGFGKMVNYAEISECDDDDMIDLNCRALVDMTVTALPYMTRGTQILEISSSASFQPLPAMNVLLPAKRLSKVTAGHCAGSFSGVVSM